MPERSKRSRIRFSHAPWPPPNLGRPSQAPSPVNFPKPASWLEPDWAESRVDGLIFTRGLKTPGRPGQHARGVSRVPPRRLV